MIKLLINDRKYGILYKGSIFDINSLQEIEGEYTTLKVGKLQHLPNAELDMELIKKLRRKFPYTKIGNTYAFHLNWHQKFFVKINKDNTMNIYAGYPIFVQKRLLKFLQNVIPQNSVYNVFSIVCGVLHFTIWTYVQIVEHHL